MRQDVSLVLMLAIVLMLLNCSRILCTFCCLLDVLLSLIPVFDPFADVSQLGHLFLVHVFSMSCH